MSLEIRTCCKRGKNALFNEYSATVAGPFIAVIQRTERMFFSVNAHFWFLFKIIKFSVFVLLGN